MQTHTLTAPKLPYLPRCRPILDPDALDYDFDVWEEFGYRDVDFMAEEGV